jgi:transcriptional regulator with XRE-family HTH domain
MSHYTAANVESFLGRITFDFMAQLQNRLATSEMTQAQLAKKLGVTESAVSQVLNLERVNPNLKTMVGYARALGMKIAVVAYDDGDPNNNNGPVGSEIFGLAWEKLGRPRDTWSVDENVAANFAVNRCLYTLLDWRSGWANSTLDSFSSTAEQFPMNILLSRTQEGSTAHAGN